MNNERVNRKMSGREVLEHAPALRPVHAHSHRKSRRSLRVMKFGGTSVGNASCIRRVAEIVCNYSTDCDVIVIVSAMSGVTNKLIQAGNYAAAGDLADAASILNELRLQHEAAIEELIGPEDIRRQLSARIAQLLAQCGTWCENIALAGEVSPALQDSISGAGERLSAPILAATLTDGGTPAEAIEATELVRTTGYHGAADPLMQATRDACQTGLRPLLNRGVVPVVTGFIGAAPDGALTTLGRGGSDYSATIVGAAIGADEVIIWTDVDGMLTADPRTVPAATTIAEISYTEAAELAYFGAKVLHPKTLDPVLRQGIPVWIKNTFAPEKRGTKITPTVGNGRAGVKALTSIDQATLITFRGSETGRSRELLTRARSALASIHADILMSPEAIDKQFRLVIASKFSQAALEVLRREFESDLQIRLLSALDLDANVSIVTVVGQDLDSVKDAVQSATAQLASENVSVIATAQRSSSCSVSFLIDRNDVHKSLALVHRVLQPAATVTTTGFRQLRRSDQQSSAPSSRAMQVRRSTRTEEEGLNFRPAEGLLLHDKGNARDSVVLDEVSFRNMIALERKRTERSRNTMLLMLLDAGNCLSFDKTGRVLSNIVSALSLSTRDTDVVGWYKNHSVVGVMFTDITLDDHGEILGTMMHRVSQTMRNNLSLERFSQIGISMHVFPESWSHETLPGNPALYPDLVHRENTRRSMLAAKRVMDIFGSITALILLSPLYFLVGALVKLNSKGPVLFKQERLGQFGKPFTFLKFRSMYVNNDHSIHKDFMKRVITGDHNGEVEGEKEKVYKMTNDPRITPLGRFLRRTSLDELPQFINVLKGDMSLVGPRPPIAYECQEYDIWHRRRVLEVKPGITGLWQVRGRSRIRFDDMVRLDLQYVRSWSLWLDLQILLKTPAAVLLGNDAF